MYRTVQDVLFFERNIQTPCTVNNVLLVAVKCKNRISVSMILKDKERVRLFVFFFKSRSESDLLTLIIFTLSADNMNGDFI